uniref:Uncharacterized protein n=1 Tax=Anguilla anguilla TaxID=7936 RepID=A0A0E9WFP4_ANGAN
MSITETWKMAQATCISYNTTTFDYFYLNKNNIILVKIRKIY